MFTDLTFDLHRQTAVTGSQKKSAAIPLMAALTTPKQSDCDSDTVRAGPSAACSSGTDDRVDYDSRKLENRVGKRHRRGVVVAARDWP